MTPGSAAGADGASLGVPALDALVESVVVPGAVATGAPSAFGDAGAFGLEASGTLQAIAHRIAASDAETEVRLAMRTAVLYH